MTHEPSNTPAPDDLLLTAREALKPLLADTAADHDYTIRMAMNAMGIAARALRAAPVPTAHPVMSDAAFRDWVRQAGAAALLDPDLTTRLRRQVAARLAVSNPRFKPASPQGRP